MESQNFLNFWGLGALPGQGPVELEQLFWQDRTQTLSQRLLLCAQKPASLAVLTAPAGHGKSTFARWLYQRLDVSTHDAALFSLLRTEHEAGWLLQKLGQYLGLPKDSRDSASVLGGLKSVHGRVLTIIIDNAHMLATPEAFDEITSLCQIQSLIECRINFILLGNPRLAAQIEANRDLHHRVTLLGEFNPLSRSELQVFLAQRLQELGLPRRALVPESLALIAQQGVMTFAGINALLEGCLFEAFLREQKTISPDVVHAALEQSALRPRKDEDDAVKASRLALQKRPAHGKGLAAAGGSDLNALYYKGKDSPEDEE